MLFSQNISLSFFFFQQLVLVVVSAAFSLQENSFDLFLNLVFSSHWFLYIMYLIDHLQL